MTAVLTTVRPEDDHRNLSRSAGCVAMNDLPSKLKRIARVVVGGPLGLIAWSLSGAGAMAMVFWGIKAVAIPLLMLKTASWGIWGLGVIREAKTRKSDQSPIDG